MAKLSFIEADKIADREACLEDSLSKTVANRVIPQLPRCSCDPFAPKHALSYRVHGWLICAGCRGRIY